MKSFIKNLSVVAIIVAMVFAFIPSTIFAAETITITVNGAVKERTLSAYKLFTIEDVDGGNYYYSWSEEVKTFFKNEYGYETILDAIDALKGFTSEELNDLAEKFHDYTGISAEDTQTAGANATSLNLTVNGAGYYIVYDETTSKPASVAMLNNLTESQGIDIKIDEVAVPEKEPDVTSANIGDTVTFTVKSEVPTMVGYTTYTFNIVDTLSKGLTFDSDSVTVKIGDTTITKSDAETKTAVTYTVTPVVNADDTTTVTIALVDLINIKTEGNNVGEVGDEIVVTYSAKLNSDAIEGTVGGHTYNDVKITYSNDPYTTNTYTTDSNVVHVYTYTVNFTKKNTAGETLEGAKFVLKSGDKFVKYVTVDGKTEIELVNTQAEATVVTSDANGAFSFAGLKEGTYTLVETEAPAGYQVPNFDGFTFTITDEFNNDGTLKTVTFTYDNTEEIAKGFVTATTSSKSTTLAVEVLNAKEGVLPTTGGIGTKIFTAVGIVVMLVAGVALIYRNKRNND